MKKLILSVLAFAIALAAGEGAYAQDKTRQEKLTEHVYYFASDSLHGRKAGTPDADKAAQYIVYEFEKAGLKPYFADGWYDPFSASPYPGEYKNVVGLIEGSDPALKNEYIVLGAHYDHLGIKKGKIYNGADDNASGTAALIEVARVLSENRSKLGRSVIIAAFDAEEIGLFGSSHLASLLDKEETRVVMMMSIDMVGWLKTSGALKLEGVGTVRDGRKVFDEQASRISLVIDPKKFERSVFTATDTEGFARNGVPTLAVTTGLKSPYHKPEDDADLIDYEGLDKVTGYIADVTEVFSTEEGYLGTGRVAPKHRQEKDFNVKAGVLAGYNSTAFMFTEAAFNGKSILGYQAGAEVKFNMKNLGLQVQALYGRYNAYYPDRNDLFASALKYHQNQLTVPVNIVLQTRQSQTGSLYLGGGVHYLHVFDHSWTGVDGLFVPKTDQWGYNICLGMRLAGIVLEAQTLYSMGSIFEGTDVPGIQRVTSSLNLKYLF